MNNLARPTGTSARPRRPSRCATRCAGGPSGSGRAGRRPDPHRPDDSGGHVRPEGRPPQGHPGAGGLSPPPTPAVWGGRRADVADDRPPGRGPGARRGPGEGSPGARGLSQPVLVCARGRPPLDPPGRTLPGPPVPGPGPPGRRHRPGRGLLPPAGREARGRPRRNPAHPTPAGRRVLGRRSGGPGDPGPGAVPGPPDREAVRPKHGHDRRVSRRGLGVRRSPRVGEGRRPVAEVRRGPSSPQAAGGREAGRSPDAARPGPDGHREGGGGRADLRECLAIRERVQPEKAGRSPPPRRPSGRRCWN